jgi:hypothetical protein
MAFAQTPGPAPRAQISLSLPGESQAGPAATSRQADRAKTPGPENLVTFDYRRAELRWSDQRWELMADGVLLKDFGRREADAREALRVIQNLGLTQRGTVGTPRPIMEYWLADGMPPPAFGSGSRVQALDTATLRVEEMQGQWCVRDSRRVLFVFGFRRDDADQALALIRHYGFTHIGAIGQIPSAMVYFLGGDGRPLPTPIVTNHEARLGPPTTVPPASQGIDTTPAFVPQKAGVLAPEPFPTERRPFTGHPTGAASVSDRVVFDYRQVQLRQDQGKLKLVLGSYVFADFGADRMSAEQALGLFQHYRFTEQCLIGHPHASYAYFLVAGRAPRGLQFGLAAEPFRPAELVLRKVGNDWLVCEGERLLVNLHDNQDDARQLVQAIQRHGFDHLCRVGREPGQALTFMVRAH